ncbi:bifunctional riboflavin kinase/FAD synthetase [Sphingomonas sp. ID0503]|uniref:bifunctional riboflavin kinase/FAD synthetase n=1 Tax=Sphingomonas sp. ID0503 TaxID=3399691 RepID=UPI003AFB27CF
MERLDGGSVLPAGFRGGVIALGNFDGFHRGHRAVADAAIARARAIGGPAIIATFAPHPACFFRPDTPPFQLTTLEQRQRFFAEAGADAMLVFPFDARMAEESADDFVLKRLVGAIGAKGVVTGVDFTFGKGRSGDIALLRDLGGRHGLTVEAVEPVRDAEGIISSSRIRQALREGDCGTAAALLTRPFVIEGQVEHGAKLGRTIGYPTANVALGGYIRPRYGIYAVRGHLPDGRELEGAANIGVRPTFDPPIELLEAFFFDYAGDLYGQTIGVEFVGYIRPEAKFDTLDALTAQMDKDCAEARAILARTSRLP